MSDSERLSYEREIRQLRTQLAQAEAKVERIKEVAPYIPCSCRIVAEFKPQETTIPMPPVKVKCFACEARTILSEPPSQSLSKFLEPVREALEFYFNGKSYENRGKVQYKLFEQALAILNQLDKPTASDGDKHLPPTDTKR